MYTEHGRTLAIKSKDIIIGLTESGKTWVTENNKLSVLLKKFIYIIKYYDNFQ